ncbi:unnamed protein product [Prorocentrum cordatum]|uniref:Phosphoglycerate kinase n=1 Tax=Prorocentrum cordatum TaxID=2364126 RepID=A0ABN9Y9P0_9DINO|nr:unnamed protein product [Polarella glacialis]
MRPPRPDAPWSSATCWAASRRPSTSRRPKCRRPSTRRPMRRATCRLSSRRPSTRRPVELEVGQGLPGVAALDEKFVVKKSVENLGDVDLKGKAALIRYDLNVPLYVDQEIADEKHIAASIPTDIKCAPECKAHDEVKGGAKFDPELAESLASPTGLFGNDTFGTAHRAHSSTEDVTELLETSVTGLPLKEELDNLKVAVVTLNADREIADEKRIAASIPTTKGAKVLEYFQPGQPEDGPEDKLSLKPAAKKLGELQKKDAKCALDCQAHGKVKG